MKFLLTLIYMQDNKNLVKLSPGETEEIFDILYVSAKDLLHLS